VSFLFQELTTLELSQKIDIWIGKFMEK